MCGRMHVRMDAGSHGCLDICLIDVYVLLCMYCYMHVLLCKLLGIHMLSSVLDIICLPPERQQPRHVPGSLILDYSLGFS